MKAPYAPASPTPAGLQTLEEVGDHYNEHFQRTSPHAAPLPLNACA